MDEKVYLYYFIKKGIFTVRRGVLKMIDMLPNHPDGAYFIPENGTKLLVSSKEGVVKYGKVWLKNDDQDAAIKLLKLKQTSKTTVADVLNTLNEKQKKAVYFITSKMVEEKENEKRNDMRILYECDGKACDKEFCDKTVCTHTSDIHHAKNFDILKDYKDEEVGAVEKVRKKTIVISTNMLYKPEILKKLQSNITKDYEETGFILLPPGWSYKEIDSEINIEFGNKED